MLPETLAGLDPELLAVAGTLGGIILTKSLDAIVALFKATLTTPMRLKALEDDNANCKKELKTHWDRYEEIKKELNALRDRDRNDAA